MRHEYLKLVPENISVTFTDIHYSKRQGESIIVHLERPNENGFDIAEYVLPVCFCKKCIGFTEDEVREKCEEYGRDYAGYDRGRHSGLRKKVKRCLTRRGFGSSCVFLKKIFRQPLPFAYILWYNSILD